jgi:hypothetical protein
MTNPSGADPFSPVNVFILLPDCIISKSMVKSDYYKIGSLIHETADCSINQEYFQG